MNKTDMIRMVLRESANGKNIMGVNITRPTQVLKIMRGVSGSGKSTRALKEVGSGAIHSTDDLIEADHDYRQFFADMITKGNFSPLHRMHGQNLKNAIADMEKGVSPVVIDNTNLTASESKAYVEAALKLGYDDKNIQFVEVGTGGVSAEVLEQRNTHGVPLGKIKQMIQKYNSAGPMTVEKVLASEGFSRPKKVLYSAVVLDDASHDKLAKAFQGIIPDGWKTFAHHMTIVFGKGLEKPEDAGKTVNLKALALGQSDKAIAVKVSGYPSKNKIPHITVAVAPDGKPVMSNDIINWKPLEEPIMLTGTVTEIKPK